MGSGWKAKLGFDHTEERSRAGLHRHALMTLIAYAFPRPRGFKLVKRRQESRWTPTQTSLSASRAAIIEALVRPSSLAAQIEGTNLLNNLRKESC